MAIAIGFALFLATVGAIPMDTSSRTWKALFLSGRFSDPLSFNYCGMDADDPWGHCGGAHPTHNMNECCNGACEKEKESYEWCWVDKTKGWEYCTSDPAVTVNGKKCDAKSPCMYYGKSYSWCYTTDEDWDYCIFPKGQKQKPYYCTDSPYYQKGCTQSRQSGYVC